MNEDIKTQWVEALESDEYKQGVGYLNANGNFCCLGVLCDLAEKAGVVEPDLSEYTGIVRYRGKSDFGAADQVLPMSVQEWAGLNSDNPIVSSTESVINSLAEFNDEGKTFTEIAKIIRERM